MAAKLEHVAGIARAETNLGGLYVLKQDSNGNGGAMVDTLGVYRTI